jgi:diguanylate cyclase (GGDEF)-like protein
MAERDALTNLLNRRSFCRDAEKKCAEVSRYGGRAFLMMIDIDFFKNVNDTYGHFAGDEVLCSVSRTLSQRLRKTTWLAVTAARSSACSCSRLIKETPP